jgi:hypothetical protein
MSITNAKLVKLFYEVFSGVYSPKRILSVVSALSSDVYSGTRLPAGDVRAVISHSLGMISRSTTLTRIAKVGVHAWKTRRSCVGAVIRPKEIGGASDSG